MTEDEGLTLRERLRAGTGAAHEALDAEVSRFDLGGEEGLAAFLLLHHDIFAHLAAARPAPDVAAALADLSERVAADLARLGRLRAAVPAPDAPRAPHPLAVRYVLAGSRLGGGVLKRRWQALAERGAPRASAYFEAPSHAGLWQAFRAEAGSLPGTGPEADRIVADAARMMTAFARAAAGATAQPVPERLA